MRVYKFAVDLTEARPLSQIEQATYGCDAVDLRRFFSRETWLTWPSFYAQILTGTEEEWRLVAHWWSVSRAAKPLRLLCSLDHIDPGR